MVDISAVICTFNRAPLLDRALASLVRQSLAADQYEVIVVDNGSTDQTQDIVAKWVAQTSNIRCTIEPQIGLSHARNWGAAEARAPFVAYLDDDAYASKDWVINLLRGFETAPQPAVVGGPVSLTWEGGQPPMWMSRHLMHALSYMDYGQTARQVTHVNGCNMAIDKSVLEAYGGFKLHLGRRGSTLLSSEESDFMYWLRAKGHRIYYEPRAEVHHYIPRQRQTVTHLLQVYYGLGFSDGLRDGREHRLYSLSQSAKQFPKRLTAGMRDSRPSILPTLMMTCCELALQMGFVAAQLSPRTTA